MTVALNGNVVSYLLWSSVRVMQEESHSKELVEIKLRKGSLGLVFFFKVEQPILGQGPLIIEASRSHPDTPHSVGILWTIIPTRKPLPDNKRHSQQKDIYAPWGDSNPRSQQASCRTPTPQTARLLRWASILLP